MTIADSRVVAWLCDAGDGVNVDAACRTHVRDDYARFGRTITPLVPLTLLAEAESRIVVLDRLHDAATIQLDALQSRLDAADYLDAKFAWEALDAICIDPTLCSKDLMKARDAAARVYVALMPPTDLRAALGGESPASDEVVGS